ncbi:PPP4R2-domain-containing protein [Lipomyces chichibuensis]|uniref:PPP4R2-domain-containing protein n=1 Tax=Lipomyces chichibuensis TaxID=1546026 RepID=UPI003343DE9C
MLLHETTATGIFDETADWPAFRTRMSALLSEISTNNFVPEPTPSQNSFLQSLLDTLNTSFPNAPPFTIQRLAELVERPNRHYGTHARDKYLRAIERVVSVESSVGDFGMAALGNSTNAGSNNRNSGTVGALTGNVLNENTGVILSPIAWLVDTGTPPPDSPTDALLATEDVKEELEVKHHDDQMIDDGRPNDEKVENGINGVSDEKGADTTNGEEQDSNSEQHLRAETSLDSKENEGVGEEPMDIE